MRTAAEIGERPVRIERDRFDPFVCDEVLDQLDLVGLILGAKALDRVGGGDLAALERLVGGDVVAHRRLDPLEVGLGRRDALGELEVVVEAAVDRRPDRNSGAGPELDDRGGHHMRGVVADQPERIVGVLPLALRGDDGDRDAVAELRREIAQLAVDLDRECVLGQPRADRGGGVGAARAFGKLERRAIGKLDGDRLHGGDPRGP